jgi:prepilin-type N-terminal cleavage/methylation domain-containing protein
MASAPGAMIADMYFPYTSCIAQPSTRGFTVVELLIGVVLVAILTAIGAPALRNFTLQQRIGTTAQELQLDMAYARSEAITRADGVSICPSTDAATCTGGVWTGARIVFVDSNGNGVVDGGDVVIRQGGTPDAGLSLVSTPAASFVGFNSRGQVTTAVVLSTCYTGLKGRDLSVRSTGNPSITTPTAVCP